MAAKARETGFEITIHFLWRAAQVFRFANRCQPSAALLLRQIEDHEGREALREAAERLLKGTAFTILQVSGLKRLNDVLDELDQTIWIEAPAPT